MATQRAYMAPPSHRGTGAILLPGFTQLSGSCSHLRSYRHSRSYIFPGSHSFPRSHRFLGSYGYLHSYSPLVTWLPRATQLPRVIGLPKVTGLPGLTQWPGIVWLLVPGCPRVVCPLRLLQRPGSYGHLGPSVSPEDIQASSRPFSWVLGEPYPLPALVSFICEVDKNIRAWGTGLWHRV